MKDTLKGGFWVALGLFILFLAVTGRLNKVPALWTGLVSWWNSGAAWASGTGKPSGLSDRVPVPTVGQQAVAITLAPLPVGPAMMS